MTQEATPKSIEYTDEENARIAAYTTADADKLASMVKGASTEVLEILAANTATSPETLETIARRVSAKSVAGFNLAENKNSLPSTLEILYKKVQGSIRTKKFLDFISNQDILSERENQFLAKLGANESTPLPILRKIASHKDLAVSFSVTSNKTLGVAERVDVLRKALELPVNSELFLAAVDHDDLPNGIRTKQLAELSKSEDISLRLAMSTMRNLNMETVGVLLGTKNDDVQENLYRNEHLPEGAYRFLAADKDFHYLQILAENPATPADIIENLATTAVEAFEVIEGLKQFEYIALSLSKNPSVSFETLSQLIENLDGNISESTLRALFQAVKNKQQ